MPDATLSGVDFKKQLRAGQPKLGLFLNAHSPTVAEQRAHSGYDWLLVDTQHGPMGYEKLSAMLSGIANGGAKSMVRVGGYSDRPGIQQALDLGADGVLIPYINSAEEARQAVSCTKYPTAGTRSVYFPQRSMNRAGLLGYAGNANNNLIVALQVETADCIKNMAEIAAVAGVDILFLGQNDLCMSMGLYGHAKIVLAEKKNVHAGNRGDFRHVLDAVRGFDLQRHNEVVVGITGIAEETGSIHAALRKIDRPRPRRRIFRATHRLPRFLGRIDVGNQNAVRSQVERLLDAGAIAVPADANHRFCAAVCNPRKHRGKFFVAHRPMLRVHQQPVVAAVSELLGDGGAVRVEEQAELGLARSKLLLEINTTQGGIGHESLLRKMASK